MRLLLLAAAAAGAILFWLIGRWLGVPAHPEFEASLLQQPSVFVALLATLVGVAAAAAVGTAVAGSVRFDAGLFAAAVGLAVLSLRGGPSRFVVQAFASPRGYLSLAIEAALLFAFFGLAWYGLWVLHRRGSLRADIDHDGLKDAQPGLGDKLYALVTHAVVMGLIVMLLAPTDEKKQVLAAVAIASIAAGVVAHGVAKVQRSIWYWGGSLLVAVVGYAAASFGPGDGRWWLGPQGITSGLARPLPLDYASVGIAGSIVGYWMGRRNQSNREMAKAEALAQFEPTK